MNVFYHLFYVTSHARTGKTAENNIAAPDNVRR